MPQRWVRRALIFALVFNVVAAASAFVPPEVLSRAPGGPGDMTLPWFTYLFLPWFTLFTQIVPFVVVALSLGVSLWRSRACALLLVLLFLANKWLALMMTAYPLIVNGLMPGWLTVTALYAVGYLVGVAATFGYHASPRADRSPRSRVVTIVGAVVSGVLLVAAGSGLSGTLRQWTVQTVTHTLEFAASSSGAAHVQYFSKSVGSGEADFNQSWSKRIDTEGDQDRMTLEVTANGDGENVVHCTITRDGQVLVEQDQRGTAAKVTCGAEVP